ncbi:MAG: TIGR03084 family protein [Alphaproteobacteria bacterium HGW-Alphaproteobacteria-18]|nr:MAG: TIGR03084 family protein [Alphaproteobacteria bacterium HGW-Alphaproteobacteria-18]
MQQAEDFRAESRALHALISQTAPVRYREPTQFKGWGIHDVLQHLHFWNRMAYLQLADEAELLHHLKSMSASGTSMRTYESEQLAGLDGFTLVAEWEKQFEETADRFASADPKTRLKWAGPDMSARSSITARLMETWAHGQEAYDHLGVIRKNEDRIGNIVTLGINTFGWTYATRREKPPGDMPYVVLEAPSGAIWTHGNPSDIERIEGLAEEFCQVVTQTRNIADTSLKVTGAIAADWMSKAQCFAGPPAAPPPAGSRFTASAAA